MSDTVFINSKKKLEFNSDSGERLTIPKGYIGSVPSWVTETWLYKAACKDSTITFVGPAKSQVVVAGNAEPKMNDPELQALREQAKVMGIRNYQNMKAETLKAKIDEVEAVAAGDQGDNSNNGSGEDNGQQGAAFDENKSQDESSQVNLA